MNIFLQGRIDDLGIMAFTNPRDYLRNRLTIQSNSLITNFKNTLYFLIVEKKILGFQQLKFY